VYTLMQNRFMGKYCWIDYRTDFITVASKVSLTDLCDICTRNNLVFPALEAFEERLENPTLYYVFYEYFLKSAIGDDEWKQRTGMHPVVQQRKRKRTSIKGAAASTPIQRDKKMATPLDKAFALVMLKNNYFAWLWKAKEGMHSTMLTDYDSQLLQTPRHKGALSLGEHKLMGSLICLHHQIGTEQGIDSELDEHDTNVVLHDQYVLWKKTDPIAVAGDGARLEVYNMEMNEYKKGSRLSKKQYRDQKGINR
jgi:hypothetical protein